MDDLETFVSLLKQAAANAGLVVCVVGATPGASEKQASNPRVLNLAYATLPSEPILQLYLDTALKVLTHRTSDLTARYRGRQVSKKWVFGFVDANSTRLAVGDERQASEGGAEPVTNGPVRCFRCSGRGTSLAGDICVYCNGTGSAVPEPLAIPHSISGKAFPKIPDNSGKLTQVEIKKMLLARNSVALGGTRPEVDQKGAAAGSNIPEFPDWRDQP
jgi:hypothetical protein